MELLVHAGRGRGGVCQIAVLGTALRGGEGTLHAILDRPLTTRCVAEGGGGDKACLPSNRLYFLWRLCSTPRLRSRIKKKKKCEEISFRDILARAKTQNDKNAKIFTSVSYLGAVSR